MHASSIHPHIYVACITVWKPIGKYVIDEIHKASDMSDTDHNDFMLHLDPIVVDCDEQPATQTCPELPKVDTATSQELPNTATATSQELAKTPAPPSISHIDDRYVPPRSFTFPKRSFGNADKKRACQHSWFDRFTWLHYQTESDSVICTVCWLAHEQSE